MSKIIAYKERSIEEKEKINAYNKKMDSEEWRDAYDDEKDVEHFAKPRGHSPLAERLVADLRRAKVIKPAWIFEIGCGQGRDGKYLAQKGHIVRGIDVSESAVKTANELVKGLPAKFSVGDAENLHMVGDESQDAVYSIAAVHGTAIKFTFKEIFRVLRSGGIAKLFLYTGTKTGKSWVSYWTPGEIKQYAKEAGFKIEQFREVSDTEPIEIPGVEGKVEQQSNIVITTFKKPAESEDLSKLTKKAVKSFLRRRFIKEE